MTESIIKHKIVQNKIIKNKNRKYFCFKNVKYINCQFINVEFYKTQFYPGVYFENCRFQNTSFIDCCIKSIFIDCKFIETLFQYGSLSSSFFSNCSFTYYNLFNSIDVKFCSFLKTIGTLNTKQLFNESLARFMYTKRNRFEDQTTEQKAKARQQYEEHVKKTRTINLTHI